MDWFELPGPRAWFVPMAEAIERRSVVVSCHPRGDVPAGLCETVRRQSERRRPVLHHRFVPSDLPAVESAIGNIDLVSRAMASWLDLDVPPGQHYGPADLLADEQTDECVLHVDARGQAHDVQATWVRFAAACAAASKELPVADRAAIVVHVLGDVTSPMPARDANLRVLWWWGAVGPLDVAVALHGHALDPVRLASVVEIARWDVTLAIRLADQWDGDPSSLDDLIPVVRASPSSDHGAVAGSAPGYALGDWMAGLAESWNGRIDHHQALRRTAMGQRLWNAQVQVVYPWLEELRTKVAADIAAEASRSGSDREWTTDLCDDLVAAEWGRLKHLALVELYLPLPMATKDLLRRAVRARNSLAHVRPISGEDLAGLHRARRTAGY